MRKESQMIQNLFQIGDAVEHRGIVVAPLFPRNDPVATYVTLDEALVGGLRIREVDESGSVPELVVENPLAERVLLYDGEELVGAKQNRILNVSVLVEAHSTLRIPVSCVEQGRWSRRSDVFEAAPHAASPELRHRKNLALHAQPLARGVSQSEVWDAVHEKATRLSVHSPTGASADTFRAYADSLRALENAFPAQPGQCGAIFGIGGARCVDAVSRPDAFARLWPKLRRGYMLDALERLDGKPTSVEEIRSFVEAVDHSVESRQPSVGLGEDIRLRSERVIGSGLLLGDETIQLTAFRSENGDRHALGRIARPSARR
jgi:hypothetical protein